VLVVICHDPSLPFVARGRQLAGAEGTVTARPAISGHNGAMRLSARNKINATVTSISSGEAIANVVLDAGGIRLVASITAEAAAELGLAAGTDVVAIVKASDVMVAVPD
jgi:molybdopterin-binding protein